jgi:hypothetical protein
MSLAHTCHRSTWIALAVVLVALSTMGEARACTTIVEGSGACPSVCVCCESPASGGPARDAVVTEAAQPDVVAQAAQACDTHPGGGCACRSRQSEVPEPMPGQRTTGEETHAGRALDQQGEAALDAAPRSLILPTWITESPPQKTPLYLRHTRLLI